MSSTDAVTIFHNYWRVPSVERTFSGWLEGMPTEEECQRAIAETIAARASWKPSEEAFTQIEQLKVFVGYRVKIQLWDPCMFALEEEGPYPCDADLVDVKVLQEGGFLQAFLLVENVVEIPNADGYSPAEYLQQRGDFLYAHVADLYEISKVVTP